LVQGRDGYFYGTTSGFDISTGSGYGNGTVFKISTNGALTGLYSFTGGNDGANPQGGLVQGSDAYFYGTTYGGGTYGNGTVFQISTNGVLTSLYSFTGTNDGAYPTAGLVQGSDGDFYGTTSGFDISTGSGYGNGTVFKISSSGALTSLYSFGSVQDTNGFRLDGAYPAAALVQGSDGYFYGTTQQGGTNGNGTVFKISSSGALTSLYSFGSVQDTNGFPLDGAYPAAALVQGSDGYFYGTTEYNGFNHGLMGRSFGGGTVFRISTNGALTTLYSFTGTNDGWAPNGLVQGSDGYFYGTTIHNGVSGQFASYFGAGTVFKINTNGALTSLYSFSGNDGANPEAALVQGSDGSFYGTTSGGGAGGAGTVFRLTIVPQPQLTIVPSGPYVILAWPTNYTGFTLQATTNLGSSAVWSTNSSPPIVIGGDNVVINAASGKQQFYRLSQ
jgi:uncharacterized repeat protein (TIGR03803 family)